MTEITKSAEIAGEVAEPEAKEGKEGKYLSAAQWAEIVRLWELGDTSLTKLSEEYDITPSALSRGLKTRGVVKGSKAHELASTVSAKVAEKVAEFAVKRRERIEQTKLEHYDWTTAIAKLAMKELVECQKAGRAFSTIDHNLKALRRIMGIIEHARMERYRVLDADGEVDQKSLPKLVIRNLTEKEIEALRRKAAAGGDELETEEVTPEAPEVEEIVVEGEESGGGSGS